jgi:hypothetical protein
MRRIGRRKSDRFKIAAGMGIALVFFLLALQTRCGGSTEVSGPSPTNQAPVPSSQQAAASPAPSSTPTPGVIGDDPIKTFDLTFSDGACFSVKNNGSVAAGLSSWYSGFDNQDEVIDFKAQGVKAGDTWERCFNKPCIQVDVDQPGVKLIGGGFFDKDMKPFVPSRSPEKVVACRTTPCVETWREDEEPTITYGEWGVCQQGETACARTRTVLVEIFETSSCTRERRLKSKREVIDETPCECACVEPKEVREVPSTVFWNTAILEGQCNPEVLPLVGIDEATITPSLNCHTTGQQRINLDYQCSADSFRTRDLCKNVACPTPPPTCDNTPASYNGNANGGLFNLQNSGDAAELAWVNANVLVGPWEKFDDEGEKDDDCFTSDHAAKVVIVKAGSEQSATWSYRTYLNVTAGQQLCSYSVAHKDVSHATYFRCD